MKKHLFFLLAVMFIFSTLLSGCAVSGNNSSADESKGTQSVSASSDSEEPESSLPDETSEETNPESSLPDEISEKEYEIPEKVIYNTSGCTAFEFYYLFFETTQIVKELDKNYSPTDALTPQLEKYRGDGETYFHVALTAMVETKEFPDYCRCFNDDESPEVLSYLVSHGFIPGGSADKAMMEATYFGLTLTVAGYMTADELLSLSLDGYSFIVMHIPSSDDHGFWEGKEFLITSNG